MMCYIIGKQRILGDIHMEEPFYTDPQRGLTPEEVLERVVQGKTNAPVDAASKTVGEIISSNVFTYFNLIFAVLAVLLALVGAFKELTFVPVILANTLIGIIQEIRSKRVLDKLSVLNAPKTRVLRGGEEETVPSEELVLDDIVLFAAGNQICADALVVDGEVQVNEALLTGEPDEITKRPGDRLMSGSFVVSGTCKARLEQVGVDSYISKLTLEAKAERGGEQSEMMRSLNSLIKMVGIVIIPIGLIMFYEHVAFMGESIRDSVTAMVAALIGMIPEGLYLLASVALAVSVIRLARRKVLIHQMSCIETLARVNVLCVDKTGTITENNMEVNEVIPLHGGTADLETLLGGFMQNMADDNATMNALKARFTKGTDTKAVKTIPFSSKTKYSGVAFEDAAYVLGAPEFVLRERYEEYRQQIEGYSQKGFRVLVFAQSEPGSDGLLGGVQPLALLLLSNPVRENAAETFRYFAQQGVDIKVISGDNAMTVSEVAKQAGIHGAERYIDASELQTAEQIEAAVLKYTVFGRVTPEQKKQFVLALQKAGKTVAMTGDGVNDILALKKADCSIAMASGSDAAAHASQLVLLDSDFSAMPAVVLEGRRVVNNIQRSSTLFLVKNIFSLLMALFSIIFMVNYPLVPSQMSLVSVFTIGVPGFFLALEPNKNIIKGKFLQNLLFAAFPAGITNFVVVGAMVVFGEVFGVAPEDISTASVILLLIVGLMVLYRVSRPMNAWRWALFGAMIVGMVVSGTLLNGLFSMEAISVKGMMLLGAFAIITEPVMRYTTLLFEKLKTVSERLAERRRRKKEQL